MGEQVVAQVEFDVARDADHHPAGQELEDTLGDEDSNDQQGVLGEYVAGDGLAEVVNRMLDDARKLHRNAVRQQHAEAAQQ